MFDPLLSPFQTQTPLTLIKRLTAATTTSETEAILEEIIDFIRIPTNLVPSLQANMHSHLAMILDAEDATQAAKELAADALYGLFTCTENPIELHRNGVHFTLIKLLNNSDITSETRSLALGALLMLVKPKDGPVRYENLVKLRKAKLHIALTNLLNKNTDVKTKTIILRILNYLSAHNDNLTVFVKDKLHIKLMQILWDSEAGKLERGYAMAALLMLTIPAENRAPLIGADILSLLAGLRNDENTEIRNYANIALQNLEEHLAALPRHRERLTATQTHPAPRFILETGGRTPVMKSNDD